MSAPNTSSYILVSTDNIDLPNSRVLQASGGLEREDTGIGVDGRIIITTTGNLANLNTVSAGGYINYHAGTFNSHTFGQGVGIEITNPDGQSGAASFAVTDNSTVQRVNVQSNGSGSGQATDTLNFIGSGSTSITAAYNSGTATTDITIASDNTPASDDATYIIQTTNAHLPHAQVLGSLTTGIMKVTTTTGVVSVASPTADYMPYSAILHSIITAGGALGGLLVGNGSGYEGLPPGVDGTVLTIAEGSVSWQAPTVNAILQSIVAAGAPAVGDLLLGASGTYTRKAIGANGTVLTVVAGNMDWVVPASPPPEEVLFVTGDTTLAPNIHYVANRTGSALAFTLPLTASVALGHKYKISGYSTHGYQIIQRDIQAISFLGQQTTVGTTGGLNATATDDVRNTIEIMCVAIDPGVLVTFSVIACTGNFEVL